MGISDVSYHKVEISRRNVLFCKIKVMFVSQFDNKYVPLCAIVTDKQKKERNHNESTDKARRI